MRGRRDWIRLCLALAGTGVATAAHASGRIELNQASVQAAGGFPYTISASGNYVLTSDLTVGAPDTTAINITGLALTDITIDLNGFHIKGVYSCNSGCPAGSASGIRTTGISVHGIVVRNGTVSRFPGTCVLLGSLSRVEALKVYQCGRDGIATGTGSIVSDNIVSVTGEHGIHLQPRTAYSGNVVQSAGQSGGGQSTIDGGSAVGGNVCDDGGCTPDGRRRYYLTTTFHTGSQALSACETGFHMASFHEFRETSTLAYDSSRGLTGTDSGAGPVASDAIGGWARTGYYYNSAGQQTPGRANCVGWTTSSAAERGTRLTVRDVWDTSLSTPLLGPFDTDTWPCDTTLRVWCVED